MMDESNICNGSTEASIPISFSKEDIVITGISGRFPESDDMDEFKKNLFDGVDMITEDERRWKLGLLQTPKGQGKVRDLTKLDAMYFGVHPKQADVMDPQIRMFLESAYEAIADAGYCAHTLRGRKIGVFMGQCFTETEGIAGENDNTDISAYLLTGNGRAITANRASFAFDFKGPSHTVDSACSSSLYAMQQAVLAITTNQCEAAIVGGVNLALNAYGTFQFNSLGVLSPGARCKTFDAAADGYVRGEAIASLFLQKACNARRVYATVLHAKVNSDGFKPQGMTYPSRYMQNTLLEEVYEEVKINPKQIDYIEAHGTGTVAGDCEEINSIAHVFRDRDEPVLVGSVKSNIGHTESASGLCSLAKVIIALENELIPPNLNYKTPNPDITKCMRVVDRPLPLKPGSLVGISSFGFGGTNVHLLLQGNKKEKVIQKKRIIPRLATVCGRTMEATEYVVKKLHEENYPDEAVVLLEEVSKAPTNGMPFRGYILLSSPDVEPVKLVERAPHEPRPVWFMFSGMGSQWPQMAKAMMNLECFSKSVKLSAKVLEPYNIDLIHLLTNGSDEDLKIPTNCFVSIAAVQIALVDILRDLEITPDGIIGHSLGETCCSYADGCFNSEQALLCAYWRGKCCELTELPVGAMAAVGLSWEDAEKRCPKGVFPACHNAADSVTISGSVEPLREFVNELKQDKIFAKEVNSCNIAFHSKYIYPMAPYLKKALDEVIPEPKPRSERWISTSLSKNNENQNLDKLSSAEYHVNNLTSPVLFHDSLCMVPKNAIVIEIAPHGLFQSIVKRTLGPESIYVSLMQRNHQNNIEYFLSSIGRLYNSGLNPVVRNIYEPISFPVSRGTPSISSLVKWDHSQTWSVSETESFQATKVSSDYKFKLAIRDSKCNFNYVLGHKIDGRVLFPATGYLMLVWQSLARQKKCQYYKLPVVFQDVTYLRATIIPHEGVTEFKTVVHETTGEFEVNEGGSVVVKGIVYVPDGATLTQQEETFNSFNKSELADEIKLDKKDFYKELRLRGYEYGPTFQGVIEANASGSQGKIIWNGNWVTFMDTMLQIPVFGIKTRGLYLPTGFHKITIDPSKQPDPATVSEIRVYNDLCNHVCVSGAVELVRIKCTVSPRRPQNKKAPVIESYQFVPNYDLKVLTTNELALIQEYSDVCSSLVLNMIKLAGGNRMADAQFLKPMKEVSQDLINQYLNEENDDYVLLNVLKHVLEKKDDKSIEEKVKISISELETSLGNDLLNSTILNEKGTRASLDLVLENMEMANSIKILQAKNRHSFAPHILSYFSRQNLNVNIDYTIGEIGSDSSKPAPVIPNTKSIKWNLESNELPSGTFDIVLAKNIFTEDNVNALSTRNVLKAMTQAVKENGFIILIERIGLTPTEKFVSLYSENKMKEIKEDDLEAVFSDLRLTIVGKKSDGQLSTLYILRKVTENTTNIEQHTAINIYNSKYDTWVNNLQKALEDNETLEQKKPIWLLADEPNSGVTGLVNCVRKEPGGNQIRCILNGSLNITSLPPFKSNDSFYGDQMKKNLVMNVLRDGEWGTFRHFVVLSSLDHQIGPLGDAYLKVVTPGDLSSLRFTQCPPKFHFDYAMGKSIKCHVYYSAINFRDIMLASGKLPSDVIPEFNTNNDHYLGLEFAGRVDSKQGRRVMGCLVASGIASTVVAHQDLLWTIPDKWTMEQASTIPLVYMTVYYALVIRGQCEKGESILIHSGSGGVGQAAIRVALSLGLEVFTTVGSNEKREYLKKVFPQLSDRNFSNSRDLSFENHIKKETQGKGVDVVLNSLSEEKLQASVRCLCPHGRFLEIGKFDIAKNNNLGMYAFLRDISFHGVCLDVLFTYTPKAQIIIANVLKLVTEGIENGTVQPLDTTVFPMSKVEEAFRFMASGKHMGKVLIQFRNEENLKSIYAKPIEIPAIPKTFCKADKTYVITGGLGGFGLELANWLIERGCTRLVLTSRNGVQTGYQKHCLRKWREDSVNVVVSNKDVSRKTETVELIQQAMKLGPVGGIFNLAMVLQDGILKNLTVEKYIQVTNPKLLGTIHLDEVTRQLCPDMDWFVCFSSVSCGRGNAGQSNYGFANSAMERICEKRKYSGLPSLAIQWGVIGDVGVVVEAMGGKDITIGGVQSQGIQSCLSTLDHLLNISAKKSTSAVFSSFVPVESLSRDSADHDKKDILQKVARILGLKDLKKIDDFRTLGELGLDSMMGVEVKQLIERDYNLNLSAQEIIGMTKKKLIEIGGAGATSATSPVETSKNENKETDGVINTFKTLQLGIPTEIIISLNEIKSPNHIFIVHDIEGYTKMLKTVASHLKIATIGLQCTDSVPVSSIQETAAHYIKEIQKIQPAGPYNIAGYSYGGVIAFEIATAMQCQLGGVKAVQSLTFLDGSPKFFQEQQSTIHEIKSDSVKAGPINALMQFLSRHVDIDYLEVLNNISVSDSWRKQFNEACDILIKHGGLDINKEDLYKAAEAFKEKLDAVSNYKSSRNFQGDVILIKANESMNAMLSADYGLQEIVDGNVQVHTVSGNHQTFLKGENALKVAQIMNNQIEAAQRRLKK